MSSRILVLGGTTLARQFIDELSVYPQFKTTVCLTRETTGYEQAGHEIIGLISGTESLCKLIQSENINTLIDATHPFAMNISNSAIKASLNSGIPLLTLQFPAWENQVGDNWIQVEDHESAIHHLARLPEKSHVFLTVGGRVIRQYASIEQIKFTARCIRTNLDSDVNNVFIIKEKGPFDLHNELTLFNSNKFDYMVTKNAGGEATYGKIIAARRHSVPVIIIKRPVYRTGKLFESVSLIIDYLLNTNEK